MGRGVELLTLLLATLAYPRGVASVVGEDVLAGAVVGTFVATLLLCALLVGVLYCCCRHRQSAGLSKMNQQLEMTNSNSEDVGSDLRPAKPPRLILPHSTSAKGTKMADIQPLPVSVSLQGDQQDTGLGFDVSGDQTGAVFVREVLDDGPAARTKKIRSGDRLLSLTVSTVNMQLEDAMTILSYSSPYPLQLCLLPAPTIRATRSRSLDCLDDRHRRQRASQGDDAAAEPHRRRSVSETRQSAEDAACSDDKVTSSDRRHHHHLHHDQKQQQHGSKRTKSSGINSRDLNDVMASGNYSDGQLNAGDTPIHVKTTNSAVTSELTSTGTSRPLSYDDAKAQNRTTTTTPAQRTIKTTTTTTPKAPNDAELAAELTNDDVFYDIDLNDEQPRQTTTFVTDTSDENKPKSIFSSLRALFRSSSKDDSNKKTKTSALSGGAVAYVPPDPGQDGNSSTSAVYITIPEDRDNPINGKNEPQEHDRKTTESVVPATVEPVSTCSEDSSTSGVQIESPNFDATAVNVELSSVDTDHVQSDNLSPATTQVEPLTADTEHVESATVHGTSSTIASNTVAVDIGASLAECEDLNNSATSVETVSVPSTNAYTTHVHAVAELLHPAAADGSKTTAICTETASAKSESNNISPMMLHEPTPRDSECWKTDAALAETATLESDDSNDIAPNIEPAVSAKSGKSDISSVHVEAASVQSEELSHSAAVKVEPVSFEAGKFNANPVHHESTPSPSDELNTSSVEAGQMSSEAGKSHIIAVHQEATPVLSDELSPAAVQVQRTSTESGKSKINVVHVQPASVELGKAKLVTVKAEPVSLESENSTITMLREKPTPVHSGELSTVGVQFKRVYPVAGKSNSTALGLHLEPTPIGSDESGLNCASVQVEPVYPVTGKSNITAVNLEPTPVQSEDLNTSAVPTGTVSPEGFKSTIPVEFDDLKPAVVEAKPVSSDAIETNTTNAHLAPEPVNSDNSDTTAVCKEQTSAKSENTNTIIQADPARVVHEELKIGPLPLQPSTAQFKGSKTTTLEFEQVFGDTEDTAFTAVHVESGSIDSQELVSSKVSSAPASVGAEDLKTSAEALCHTSTGLPIGASNVFGAILPSSFRTRADETNGSDCTEESDEVFDVSPPPPHCDTADVTDDIISTLDESSSSLCIQPSDDPVAMSTTGTDHEVTAEVTALTNSLQALEAFSDDHNAVVTMETRANTSGATVAAPNGDDVLTHSAVSSKANDGKVTDLTVSHLNVNDSVINKVDKDIAEGSDRLSDNIAALEVLPESSAVDVDLDVMKETGYAVNGDHGRPPSDATCETLCSIQAEDDRPVSCGDLDAMFQVSKAEPVRVVSVGNQASVTPQGTTVSDIPSDDTMNIVQTHSNDTDKVLEVMDQTKYSITRSKQQPLITTAPVVRENRLPVPINFDKSPNPKSDVLKRTLINSKPPGDFTFVVQRHVKASNRDGGSLSTGSNNETGSGRSSRATEKQAYTFLMPAATRRLSTPDENNNKTSRHPYTLHATSEGPKSENNKLTFSIPVPEVTVIEMSKYNPWQTVDIAVHRSITKTQLPVGGETGNGFDEKKKRKLISGETDEGAVGVVSGVATSPRGDPGHLSPSTEAIDPPISFPAAFTQSTLSLASAYDDVTRSEPDLSRKFDDVHVTTDAVGRGDVRRLRLEPIHLRPVETGSVMAANPQSVSRLTVQLGGRPTRRPRRRRIVWVTQNASAAQTNHDITSST